MRFLALLVWLPFVCCGQTTSRPPDSGDVPAAFGFLEFVAAPMSGADEKAWWGIGGSQHGIFAKRYNIAFAGYAAAALGMLGDADATNRAGRIIGDCIGRILKRDVWAYSQSKSYWGEAPWSPDPCYRENVMYTGHVLHLMALYELFTGERRYWEEGFDFVWREDKIVHYDVKRLIDVTVEQMRANPSGGVTCEPGLLFFPCNNHPHLALKLFAKLGHGDWSADAAKWEHWALSHYRDPAFGGGALNLVCHVKTGFFYPRGNPGLDGWSLLFYEPWASDRALALGLWRNVVSRIDWSRYAEPSDARGGGGCCDPQPVSPAVSAVFLAAAARECGDAKTAERLERAVDATFLVRRDGRLFLDLDREWRIGASAMRIIALALANGASFRELAR